MLERLIDESADMITEIKERIDALENEYNTEKEVKRLEKLVKFLSKVNARLERENKHI